MAKKKKTSVKKKASRKPARKTGKAGVRRADPLAPVDVKHGRGPGPLEIGQDLVARFNRGEFRQIEDTWWSPKIESVEGFGMAKAWRGRKAVEAKNNWWMQDHVIHGASAEGPFVGADHFAVRFRMDVETKSTGKREQMDEVGVYTVKDGKIVREQFMYLIPAGA